MKRLIRWLIVGMGVMTPMVVLGQDERSAAFRPMEGPIKDSVDGGQLMIAAYAVVWTLLFAFIVKMARMQASALRRISELEKTIGADSNKE